MKSFSRFNFKTEKKGIMNNVKEKVSKPLELKTLRMEEDSGKLDDEKFEKLVNMEFVEFSKENNQLDHVFNPSEELERIKTLSRSEKEEALKEFKNKLNIQRKALGKCRNLIERSIEFNNDISRENLDSIINNFSNSYGFNQEQLDSFKEVLDLYYENRKKALEMRDKYKDDLELIEHLTGAKLKSASNLKVDVDSMFIEIISNSEQLTKILKPDSDEVFSWMKGYSGVGNNGVYFNLINSDFAEKTLSSDLNISQAKKHESEHQKNRVLRQVLDKWFYEQNNLEQDLLDIYNKTDNEMFKGLVLEQYFKIKLAQSLLRAKDELLALLSEGVNIDEEKIKKLFLNDNSFYDYSYDTKNNDNKDKLYQELIQKILVGKYSKIINQAVTSFNTLKNSNGYSTVETIALLTGKDLLEWPKTVDRLLKKEKN